MLEYEGMDDKLPMEEIPLADAANPMLEYESAADRVRELDDTKAAYSESAGANLDIVPDLLWSSGDIISGVAEIASGAVEVVGEVVCGIFEGL